MIPPEKITQKKEFCDCTFKWKFDKNNAHGISIGGKILPAISTEPRRKYPAEAFTAKAFASIPCEQMLGQYKVVFERRV